MNGAQKVHFRPELIALLVLSATLIGLTSAPTAQSDEPTSGGTVAEGALPPGAVELPGKRTATSDTYELHSGLLESRIYDSPVNYKDDEGEWQPIEEGLEEGEGREIVNGANSVEVNLPSELQKGLARVTIGDEWIGSRLLATETEPAELSEGTAVYESPEAKTSFEYTTLPDGLKEEIELAGPSSPSSFRYLLSASASLHADLTADGSVVFKDEHGEAVASLPAPTVADAQTLAPDPDHVSYQLAPREGGTWVLTVSVDPEWLAAPGRAWPVRIDPTVTKEESDLDCTIGGIRAQEGWIDCGSWGRQNLLAGYNAEVNQAEDSWYRSLMYLRTSELIHGADVQSASLELYSPEAAQNTSGIAVHQVTKPWDWQANWKRYTSGHNWATEGGDYAPEALGEEKTSVRGSGAGWWSVPIQAAKVAEVAGKNEDLSVIVKLLDDKSRQCGATCTHRLLKFDSSATEPYTHPYLRVVYDFQKAPWASKMSSPEEGRKTSHYFTLDTEWNSSGYEATGVTFQLKLSRWDRFKTIPAEYVLNAKGENVDWPLPVNTNESEWKGVFVKESEPLFFDYSRWAHENSWSSYDEENIKLRAVFAGSATSKGATEPVTVQYVGEDGGLGAPTDATASVGPATLDLVSGNYTISRTDVSIPVPGSEANLEFSRTYQSRRNSHDVTSYAMGWDWQPSAPVEQEAIGQAWVSLTQRHQDAVPAQFANECWEESGIKECEEVMVEEEIPAADWVEVADNEGGIAAFEIVNGNYVAPEYMKEWVLAKEGENFTLKGPEGVQTTFVPNSGGTAGEYRPSTVSWQATAKTSRMVYKLPEGSKKYRLYREIAPAPPGDSCGESESTKQAGCRTLEFNYSTCTCEGGYRLNSISYFGPSGSGVGQVVAEYRYDSNNDLKEEFDPRLSQPLAESYTYGIVNYRYKLMSLTPPGQATWQFSYYEPKEFNSEGLTEFGTPKYNWRDAELFGRLKSVSRASLVEATPTATTTVAYQVPLSGSGAPYDLSPAAVARWGQSDYPLDATAIFRPDQVPPSPRPSDFSHATVHYMDPEGHEVNHAAVAPPGAEGPSISTSEVDVHGHVVRELTPQNRLRALAAGSGSVALSHELDSHFLYTGDGLELLESWGPLHSVRLENGETKEARAHTVLKYEDPLPPAGQAGYYLPTKETTSAYVPGGIWEGYDQRVTETHYNWNLRKPTETIVDPGEGHLAIKSVTVYDEATGLPLETRQPSNSGGGGAGTTKYVYYSAGAGSDECQGHPIYSGSLCRVTPAAQASGIGRPELLVKKFTKYNNLGGSSNVRKTLLTYDGTGRQKTKKIEGGGQAIPKAEIEYSPTLGLSIAERFKCESECGSPQFLTSLGYASQSHTAVKTPADIAVDGSGNVWVADKGNNRIVEYNEAGEFLREAGGSGSTGGKLSSPSAIDIDSSGHVWVADTANNRVAEFSETNGAFLEVFGANVNKTKVEAGGTTAEKNLCTAASGNTCQAGTAGSSPGQLKGPLGIASPSTGGVWVVDTGNSRLEKFNKETGVNTAVVSGEGTEAGKLKAPSAIAFTSAGWFWVADTGNNRVEEWNSGFGFERAVGKEGEGNGEFKSPAGIAADSGGNVWVAEQGDNRVQKLSETGVYQSKFGAAGGEEGKFSFSVPTGLVLDGKGNILVADPGNNRVEKWSTTGFDTQETKTVYDALGRPESYEDADGNVAKTTYDLDGRAVKTTDAKGSQTLRYDAVSGMPIELEDSAAGIFTASYNADGSMVKRTLPDGLTAETTYDPAGEPMHLTYTKASNCGTSCTWLDFGLERSISGQIRTETGTLGTEHYRYDKAGRLTYADETPHGGQCTSRAYTYDSDFNRLSKTTRSPGVGGVCSESGATTQGYEYDAADRLKGPTYDSWGRITSLPAEFAGGKTLTTGYFSNDLVAVQSQGGISNMFQLDATLRQRQRLQGGGLEGTEVFHYDGPSDSPAWTVRGPTWTRNITGLGGELAAVQESGKEIMLQLTDLHGDVSATAALSPEVTSLKGTFSYDEFGNPITGSAGRFGWLGGKQRRTELASGVIQMGKRSYVPALGRFLTRDPVPGGSANPYDYANQDPVNAFDLGGEKLCRHLSELSNVEVCANTARGLKKRTEHVVRVANRIEQKYHSWRHAHPHAKKPTEEDGWTVCKVSGVGLSTVGTILSSIGVGLDATGIGAPAGTPLIAVGGTSDLAGVGADEAHNAGWC
jgi:RHS repeat-associated protein